VHETVKAELKLKRQRTENWPVRFGEGQLATRYPHG